MATRGPSLGRIRSGDPPAPRSRDRSTRPAPGPRLPRSSTSSSRGAERLSAGAELHGWRGGAGGCSSRMPASSIRGSWPRRAGGSLGPLSIRASCALTPFFTVVMLGTNHVSAAGSMGSRSGRPVRGRRRWATSTWTPISPGRSPPSAHRSASIEAPTTASTRSRSSCRSSRSVAPPGEDRPAIGAAGPAPGRSPPAGTARRAAFSPPAPTPPVGRWS